MAVWGIGAYYSGSDPSDKSEEYINSGKAFIGWNKSDAPALHKMFDSIKSGDIIYIKSFTPRKKQLFVKAVGIITNTEKINNYLGVGISVKWKNDFVPYKINITSDVLRNNVYNNTLYEEFNESIIDELIDQIL